MAEIVNKRDVILQQANPRIIVVPPPDPIIVEGYTGVTLSKDAQMFVIQTTGAFAVRTVSGTDPNRMILEARLKGVTPGSPVTWERGNMKVVLGPNGTQTSEFDPNGAHTLVLTDTADPLVKTIEASSYPRGSRLPGGVVRVSVAFGGRTFYSMQTITTFSG